MQQQGFIERLRHALIEDLGLIEEYLSLSQEIKSLYPATHDAEGKRLIGADVGTLRTKQEQQTEIGIAILRRHAVRFREIDIHSDTLYAEWLAEQDDEKRMDKTKITLPAFIKQIMAAKALSYRDIEERSQGRISYGYVHSLVQGHYKNPSVEKIKALAKGMGVPEETLNKIVWDIPLDERDDPATLVVEEAIIERGMKLTKEEKKKDISKVADINLPEGEMSYIQDEDKYMRVEEVATYLGFAKSSLYNLVHTNKIPFHKIGPKAVRFKKKDIDRWVERLCVLRRGKNQKEKKK